MPKITFLCMAYNAEKYIEKMVRSVLSQTMDDIELCVRNNGSQDKTGELLDALARTDGRLRIVHNKENFSFDDGSQFNEDGVLRNWSADGGELGEYVSIVDADDWLDPGFADELYRAATSINADIACCGCKFMQDGRDVGHRLPPEISAPDFGGDKTLLSNHNVFGLLYNNFRTWWGRIFRSEFFLEHYDDAWRMVGGQRGAALDTVIMLRYLLACKSLVCITRPLYNFRSHSGSNYNSRPPVFMRFMEADVLYATALALLERHAAVTPPNVNFLYALNWAYIVEALQGLNAPQYAGGGRRELSWLAAAMNNSVLGKYMRDSEKVVLDTALKYVRLIWERTGAPQLYTSYLARLFRVSELIKSSPDNKLLLVLLTGCLYDQENHNLLGLMLRKRLIYPTEGCREHFGNSEREAYRLENNFMLHSWVSGSLVFRSGDCALYFDDVEDVKALEVELAEHMDAGRYEDVCDVVERITDMSPFNRNAMYCRIQMALLAEDIEFAVLLACTARVLYPLDTGMQRLCWEILDELEKESAE